MKTVYINNLGYVAGPSVVGADIAIEVADEIADKLLSWPLGKLWRYNKDTQEFILETSYDEADFRIMREAECFSVINRSFLWYLELSDEQKNELIEWYHAWLDITETKIIPEKPSWLD